MQVIATLRNNATCEEWPLMRSVGRDAPICMTGTDNVLAYWETRWDMFEWACEQAGTIPQDCVLVENDGTEYDYWMLEYGEDA